MVMWIPLAIMAASAIAGKIGKGKADARNQQNQFAQNENQRQAQIHGTQQRSLVDLLGLQENATMDRAQMGVQAPQARAKQALLGSLMQNLQPASLSGLPPGVTMPQMSGGLTPAAINPAARAGGGELQRQALLALLSKSDVPTMTDYPKAGMLPAPVPQGYKDAGKFESIMSAIGAIGAGSGAVYDAYKNRNAEGG
jgi:hypothetical protein